MENGAEEIIYIAWAPWEASLIKNLLNGYEIPCRLIREVPDILPFTINGLGKIQIAVPAKYAQDAKNLLKDLKKGVRIIK